MTKGEVDKISYDIIGAAIKIHKTFGGNMLENVYKKCMADELRSKGYQVVTEKNMAVIFNDKIINSDLRCDMIVNDTVVVELKVVAALTKAHEYQILTYMRMLRKPKGILINFNCSNIFQYGQKTYVNQYYSSLPNGNDQVSG
jgi:GxxExxY protein